MGKNIDENKTCGMISEKYQFEIRGFACGVISSP
jgi:hypothetical protein